MTVKKKLKSIIKQYNCKLWMTIAFNKSYDNFVPKHVRDIEDLEKKLLDGTFPNPLNCR
jgi:hypothetical protein